MIERASKHLSELDGYLELGMTRECLRLARRMLKHPTLTVEVFAKAVEAVLIQEDRLERWRGIVDGAFERFWPRERRLARRTMLSFHVAREDWEAAGNFLPRRCGDLAEGLFAAWTLLRLRRLEDCERVVAWMTRRAARGGLNDLEESAVLEAAACWLAAGGALDEAEDLWRDATKLEALRENAWMGLIDLQTARARIAVADAKRDLAAEAFDAELALPGNEKRRRAAFEGKLRKKEGALERVLGKGELWRFGIWEN